MFLRSGIICLKDFNMKLLCIQITKTCSISWHLVFWIDFKLNGHCLCFDFGLSSHITLGANKGNRMHYPIIHTLWLKREMPLMNNNVMTFSSLNTFDFKHFGNYWWQNLFSSNSWRFEKTSSYCWHPKSIKESTSNPIFL